MARRAVLIPMLKLQIPKNRMKALIHWLRDEFDPDRLEPGWEDYHKGRVSGTELRHGLEIHALVKDTKPYEVILDMESLGKSECSCTEGAHCQHMAAVIFSLYTSFGRPELLLQQLKKAMLVRIKQQQARKTQARLEKKAADRLDPPKRKQKPGEWQRYFDQQFYGFSLSQQHSIELFHSSVREKLLPVSAEWPSPMAELYELHVLLFVMRKIEQFYQDTKTSYLSYYIETGCRTVGRQSLDQLLALIPRLDVEQLAAGHAAAWKETLGLIGESALSGKESPLSWSTVYRSLWWRMEKQADWIREERGRLQRLLDSPDLMPRRRDALLLADAHFDVMDGRESEARARLERLHKREAREFFLYLHRRYEEGAWDSMLAWLRWLLPAVQRTQQEELRQFCHYWMEAASRQKDDSEWVDVMIALLPRTYNFYTAYLLKARRYKAWIDLQLSNRVSPMDLFAPDLQTVEKEDALLLLPLYSQAVERCIAEKNRTAYATAVRLLKKLHSLYRKLEREAVWDEYIHRLSMKYSRLRALQEELKKGKWIP
ncbi:SWIM zinc finger family protein [Paenibacillus sp. GD4]|uniref:SWIM zinc finger family protein n=1 Tax=Paenibacillus sp. GD4 TaxID=3068890 RepID=UPI002796A08E|nr:SWIM zinc finger family protein [Paenibacillus sp. GD4]MDQ1911016.1 SWIM zinc finger family protein [Paenibacillus sp. GD4]